MAFQGFALGFLCGKVSLSDPLQAFEKILLQTPVFKITSSRQDTQTKS